MEARDEQNDASKIATPHCGEHLNSPGLRPSCKRKGRKRGESCKERSRRTTTGEKKSRETEKQNDENEGGVGWVKPEKTTKRKSTFRLSF